MICLIDGPVLLEYFPTKVGGGAEVGEEDDEAMGRKEGMLWKQSEGKKRKQTWKCKSKKSWKAGEENCIYKGIQSTSAWEN